MQVLQPVTSFTDLVRWIFVFGAYVYRIGPIDYVLSIVLSLILPVLCWLSCHQFRIYVTLTKSVHDLSYEDSVNFGAYAYSKMVV